MDQLEFFEIPSPCIGVCQSGKSGFCIGCFRSRDERLYWNKVTPEVKRKIIKACQRRKKQAQSKKGIIIPSVIPVQQSLFDEDEQ